VVYRPRAARVCVHRPRHSPERELSTSHEWITLRLFDLETKQWSIHWADTTRGRLDPPLYGTFYGDDVHAGQPVRVRFLWRDLGEGSATWEQAFSADGGATWETNWTMAFTRTA
jgi:hypothetical protein